MLDLAPRRSHSRFATRDSKPSHARKHSARLRTWTPSCSKPCGDCSNAIGTALARSACSAWGFPRSRMAENNWTCWTQYAAKNSNVWRGPPTVCGIASDFRRCSSAARLCEGKRKSIAENLELKVSPLVAPDAISRLSWEGRALARPKQAFLNSAFAAEAKLG